MYFLKTIDTDLGREIQALKAKWVGLIQTTVTGWGGVLLSAYGKCCAVFHDMVS